MSAEGPLREISYGTCFAISKDGYLLTARHVAAGASALLVQFDHQPSIKAEVVTESAANDWALLKVPIATPVFLSVAPTSSVDSGAPVFTFGYPAREILGQEAKYTEGAISALTGLNGEPSEMQIQIPIQPGSSGGPVVAASGEVVGIVTSSAKPDAFFHETGTLPQNINWATKSDVFIGSLPKAIGRQLRAASLADAKRRARAATCLLRVMN